MAKKFNIEEAAASNPTEALLNATSEPPAARPHRAERRDRVKKRENRSERVQVLITPTLKRALEKEAQRAGTSTNQAINYILEKYFEREI